VHTHTHTYTCTHTLTHTLTHTNTQTHKSALSLLLTHDDAQESVWRRQLRLLQPIPRHPRWLQPTEQQRKHPTSRMTAQLLLRRHAAASWPRCLCQAGSCWVLHAVRRCMTRSFPPTLPKWQAVTDDRERSLRLAHSSASAVHCG
jgi:hypothetical protein